MFSLCRRNKIKIKAEFISRCENRLQKERHMTGKLYGVGVGPGDPELITLKALRLTKEADILAFPGENPREEPKRICCLQDYERGLSGN